MTPTLSEGYTILISHESILKVLKITSMMLA